MYIEILNPTLVHLACIRSLAAVMENCLQVIMAEQRRLLLSITFLSHIHLQELVNQIRTGQENEKYNSFSRFAIDEQGAWGKITQVWRFAGICIRFTALNSDYYFRGDFSNPTNCSCSRKNNT